MIKMIILNFFEYIRDPNIGAFMGIYANKNYLITIVLVSSIFSIKYIINHRIILGGILFILNSLMNFATGSRVGMVCYVFLLFFSGLLFLKKIDFSGVIKLFCIIMMLGLLLYLITHYFDIPALKRIFFDDGTAATGLSRGETWNAAIPIFFSKPIFGWGNNIVYLNIHHMTQIGNNFYWGFHNSYLVMQYEAFVLIEKVLYKSLSF